MRMEDTLIEDVLVLKPASRRIEASTSSDFKSTVAEWIKKGHRRIVLDLAGIDFIDSSGLGAIISSLKSVGDGGDLVLCNISEQVMNLFRLTRMNRVFAIFDSREKAVDHFPK